MARKSDKGLSAGDAIVAFERQIARQENIIYGTALCFECLSAVHASHPGIVETHRKQFRNIIHKGREMTARASDLVEEVRNDPSKAYLLEQFAFTPCDGHPRPLELAKRAEILVAAYDHIFPGRPKSQDFSQEETLQLIEEASKAM